MKASMKVSRNYIFFILILSVLPLRAQNYYWPTTASKHMSSGFCEYRPGHYHSAIDIKTWNREGYPVFAVDDGRIVKIRISPFFYGKVMYLKLKDGRYAVYAHLKKFNPRIEKAIRQLQLKERRYSVTWQPKNWRVKKGELLAYTGQTGIGVPHLHFEIRDAHNHPLNPLKFYKEEIKDTIAPILQELLAIPLNANSTVNGSHLPQIIPLVKGRNHIYHLKNSLSAHGTIGLALRSYDMADGVYNKFAYYQSRLFLDDKEIFAVSYDTLDFGKTRQADVEVYYPFKALLHKRFRKMFIEPFNTLPFYYKSPGNGILRIEGKVHHFRLEVSDFYGNTSVVKGRIQSEINFTPKIQLAKKFGHFAFLKFTLPSDILTIDFHYSVDGEQWNPIDYYEILDNVFLKNGLHTFFIKADLKDSNATALRLTFTKQGFLPRTCFIVLSNSCALPHYRLMNAGKRFIVVSDSFTCCPNLRATVTTDSGQKIIRPDIHRQQAEWILPPPKAQRDSVHLTLKLPTASLIDTSFSYYTLFPSRAQKMSFFDGALRLQTKEETVYDTLLFTLTQSDTVPAVKGIPVLSPVYTFDWYPQIFRLAADLTIKADTTFISWQKIGVCTMDRSGRLHWHGGKVDSLQQSVTTRIKTLNSFLLAADTVAPSLRILKPAPNAIVQKLKEIRLALDDSLSGIGTDRNIQLFVDSTFVIPEWDPERKLVFGHPEGGLKPGRHQITAIVRDMAGNWIKKSLIFNIEKKR